MSEVKVPNATTRAAMEEAQAMGEARKERKQRQRHPSTEIPAETVTEIAYRVYLLRLDPPMTPEESAAAAAYKDSRGREQSDVTRRRNAVLYEPLVRVFLRVAVDMDLMRVGVRRP